jgi:LysR family transcriptional regulator, cell division regulator
MVFGMLEAIFGCVSAGLGITLLPRALIGRVCAEGPVSIHTLPRADAMVETVHLSPRQRPGRQGQLATRNDPWHVRSRF